jgi:tetrahydromethanopterin S-methyltransferase subunit H
MFKFTQEQKICKIGDINLGGQPGENPTVLIGSIFYRGHRIVSDPDEGIFDKQKAKDLLDREAELSAETGNPRIIDVVGDATKALIKYIEFVAANSTSPILVDSSLPKARLEAIKHFAKTEVVPRLIYSSVDPYHTDDELACIKDCGIKSAIVLAFTAKAVKPKNRVKLLTEDLLVAAQRADVENMLIDVGVLDIPSIGWSTQAIWEVKEALGYPCGCATANALYMWGKLKKKGAPTFESVGSVVLLWPISWGANFILYGPIRNAPWVYPACAALDAMVAYGGMSMGIHPTKEHPLYRIF